MPHVIRIGNNGKDKYFISDVKIRSEIIGGPYEEYTVVTVDDPHGGGAAPYKTGSAVVIEVAV